MHRIILTAFALALTSVSGLAQADQDSPRGLVIVTEGTVRRAPDFAILRAGVVTTGKTAEEALASNRPAMNQLPEIARRFGVSTADIKTSAFSLTPKFRQVTPSVPQSPGATRVVDGYEARTNLEITVRKLPSIGPLIDELVKSGSNVISNVSFGLNDIEAIRDEARQKAAQLARTRARLYADSLGVELGELVSAVDEAAGSISAMRGEADLPAPRQGQQRSSLIEPGEISISSSLKTIWQLGRR